MNTARLVRHPIESLLGWHRRYGDVFTVRFLVFGKGVYVADPDAIREMLTGDQSDLHAGEANAPLAPVLGDNSVLVLDGPEHLRQRKLLLPPFQGSAVQNFRTVIREVAEAEVDRWREGERFVLRERMRALTFEVICRAVFGVTEPERIERLRAALRRGDRHGSGLFLPGPLRRDLGPLSPWGRLQRRVRVADALLYEEIARRRREPDLDERHRRPLAPAARAGRGRRADDRRRAARRADDDARCRPRDDRHRPRLRLRPAAARAPRVRWRASARRPRAAATPT